MTASAARGTDLGAALATLDRRVRGYSARAWGTGGRSDVAFVLAGRLVELARAAGDPVPAAAAVPTVAEHGIADVLAVLGADLVAALDAHPDAELIAAAVHAVNDALEAFDATSSQRMAD